jgi:hypothetical protein
VLLNYFDFVAFTVVNEEGRGLAGAAAGAQKAASSIATDRQRGRRIGGCIGEESYHRARSFGQKSIGKQALVTGCKSREN